MMRERCVAVGTNAVVFLVFAAVAWSTLALGAVWDLGLAITYALVSAAFCIWMGLRLFCDSRTSRYSSNNGELPPDVAPRLRMNSRFFGILTVVLGGFIILQTVPLPFGLVGALSPVRAEQMKMFAGVLPEINKNTLTLAVDASVTRKAFQTVAIIVMAFVLGGFIATRRRNARRFVGLLLILALFEALYGLLENLSGHNHIFWIPVGEDYARGTFYNRNHFAATLSLFFPVMIGWFYLKAVEAKKNVDRDRSLPSTSWQVLGTRQGLWLLGPAALVLGIIQSHSRGGFASMLFALALMFVIGLRSRAGRALSALMILVAAVLFAYAVNSDYKVVLDRFEDLQEKQNLGRLEIWGNTWEIIKDYPLFGIGFGNFPRVYMQYAQGTPGYAYRAHNEWLEGLATLGFPGMAMLTAIVVYIFVRSFRRIRFVGRDQPWLLGIWCGLIGLALHSFAEFNFHVPSIALTASLFSGILLGYRIPKRRSRKSPPLAL